MNRRQMLRQTGFLAGCTLLTGCGRAPAPPLPPGERIAYGKDPFQFGELRLPSGKGPHPVMVVFHGGFWRSTYGLDLMDAVAAALMAAGWATWNVEYRRLGNRGGGWPGTFLDVATATDYLRQLAGPHRLDLEKVTTLGHSAGGHLALWLAARHRLKPQNPLHTADPLAIPQAVSLAGVADLRQAWQRQLGGGVVEALLGGTPEQVSDRFAAASPAALLPLGPQVRQVLVHGARDFIVPLELSKAYQKAAKAKGDDAELIELPDADHFAVINPADKAWETIRKAVSRSQ